MVDKDPMAGSAEDDLVLSATYGRNYVWFWFIANLVLMCALILVCYYEQLPVDSFMILIFIFPSLLLLQSTRNLVLPCRILFYPDRVMETRFPWRLRIIYYHRAEVWASGDGRWFPKSYQILELKENGRPFFLQLPIAFYASQFSAETMAKMDAVMTYLKECTRQGCGAAQSCTLSKDVLYQNKAQA